MGERGEEKTGEGHLMRQLYAQEAASAHLIEPRSWEQSGIHKAWQQLLPAVCHVCVQVQLVSNFLGKDNAAIARNSLEIYPVFFISMTYTCPRESCLQICKWV